MSKLSAPTPRRGHDAVRAVPLDGDAAIRALPDDHRITRGPWLPGIARNETDAGVAYRSQFYEHEQGPGVRPRDQSADE